MSTLRILSVAVSSGRVGHALLDSGKIYDWAVTTSVSGKSTDLVAHVQELINTLEPDVVVTERCDTNCRKGRRTKKLIASIAELASHNYVLDVNVPRPRRFPSKHEEAQNMVERHPDLSGYMPTRKRRFFDFEPRTMIVFEALALAEEVKKRPDEPKGE